MTEISERDFQWLKTSDQVIAGIKYIRLLEWQGMSDDMIDSAWTRCYAWVLKLEEYDL